MFQNLTSILNKNYDNLPRSPLHMILYNVLYNEVAVSREALEIQKFIKR